MAPKVPYDHRRLAVDCTAARFGLPRAPCEWGHRSLPDADCPSPRRCRRRRTAADCRQYRAAAASRATHRVRDHRYRRTGAGCSRRCRNRLAIHRSRRRRRSRTAARRRAIVPFDLARPPLLRFVLASLPSGEHRLVITMHHIVLDGWSMPLLLRDLLVLYAIHSDTSSSPAARSYRDFLAWLAERDHPAAIDAWRAALAESAGPTLIAPPAHRAAVDPRSHRLHFGGPRTTAHPWWPVEWR